ncbi:unnamed protein product [Parnassius apollo]|uniref:(apollo) hypothetical protein n=1 Tax=Parnassius apollo TaxID=110799 RepID=A0A8S3XST9_PARAO|nr:unnamed protein product [Parnassius apollo]
MHAAVPKRKKRAEGEMIYKEDDISVAGKTLKQLGDTKEKKRFKNIDSVVSLSEKRPLDKSDPLTNRPESKINDNVSTEQIFEKGSGHKTYQNKIRKLGQSKTRKTRKLSVVTQDQFQALGRVVEDLQNQFGEITSAYLPENIELMQELHKGASLTDAMAALQLSARLDAAEKTLNRMLSLITDLASRTPGTDVTVKYEGQNEEQTMEHEKPMQVHYKKFQKVSSETQSFQASTTNITHVDVAESEKDIIASKNQKWITSCDLDCSLQELQEEILKEVTNITHTNIESANNALKLAKRLETKLEATLHLQSRMNDLETLVSDYADHVNIIDTGLTSQITNYQEQLTQMQNDLETCLENMAEALANTGGDAAAVAELNAHFTNLQEDFDKASTKQRGLQEMQNSLHLDLKTLWQQIEQLRDTKPDREEVSDALRDKAGLEALNGLVSQQHFDAVRGDFQKSISAAYEKFNNQELIWQASCFEQF